MKQEKQQTQNQQRASYRQDTRTESTAATPKKKIIPENEGEYVDYEEVK